MTVPTGRLFGPGDPGRRPSEGTVGSRRNAQPADRGGRPGTLSLSRGARAGAQGTDGPVRQLDFGDSGGRERRGRGGCPLRHDCEAGVPWGRSRASRASRQRTESSGKRDGRNRGRAVFQVRQHGGILTVPGRRDNPVRCSGFCGSKRKEPRRRASAVSFTRKPVWFDPRP